MPIDHIQNNQVKAIFEKIIMAAQGIEAEWNERSLLNDMLEIAASKYHGAVYSLGDSTTRVFAVPEAMAEMASYLVSLQVRGGLHAVIDFGAGTTDLSIFYIENVGQANATTYWYAAKNIPRGTQRIERIVAESLRERRDDRKTTDAEIAEALVRYQNLSSDLKIRITKEIEELWKDTHLVWGEAYRHRKTQSEWMGENVHIFTCGGGANLPPVNEVFRKSWMDGWGPYPIRKLPMPDDFDSLGNRAAFDRLSVAYGLTIPIPELSDYKLPADCPVHVPPQLPIRNIAWWDTPVPNQNWLRGR